MIDQDSLDGEAEVLLDPNSLSEDGTVALSTKSFSENGEFMAYALSSSGSDWVTINVMRVEDRVVQPDTLSWVRYCYLVPLSIHATVERSSPSVRVLRPGAPEYNSSYSAGDMKRVNLQYCLGFGGTCR